MYTMVMMAALTTGIDMPDRGRRGGGGCCGCYGGGGYGMGMGMGYGGGCYGGMGMGYGGGCGGGWGGGYGMGMGCGGGGYAMGYGGGWGGGYGYGGYALGAYSPTLGSYAYSPMMSSWGWGTPIASGGTYLNSGTTRSFYANPTTANEATIIVNLPENASLSIDGQQTQQRSGTRTFTSPPLESGKTYTYTLRAELDRDGHLVQDTKTVEVRAGQRSEVTMKLSNSNRDRDDNGRRGPVDETPLRRQPNP